MLWAPLQCGSLLLVSVGAGAAAKAADGGWVQLSREAEGPPGLLGTAGCRVDGEGEDDTLVLIFGGCTSSCCYAPIDSVWALSLSSITDGKAAWSHLPRGQGLWPSPRFGAVAAPAMDDSIMLMFGGMSSVYGPLDDLWAFDAPSAAWHVVPQQIAPPARASAAATTLFDHLAVFGGTGRDALLADLWLLPPFDPQAEQAVSWLRAVPAESSGAGNDAAAPPPLMNAVLAPCGDLGGDEMAIYLFGGSDELGNDHNTLWRATLQRLDDGQGGYAGFEATWAQIKPVGEVVPPPRHSPALLLAESRRFVVFGGQQGTRESDPFLNDTWVFDGEENVWTRLDYGGGGAVPDGRAAALAVPCEEGGAALLFGGFSGYFGGVDDRLRNDLWSWRGPSKAAQAGRLRTDAWSVGSESS